MGRAARLAGDQFTLSDNPVSRVLKFDLPKLIASGCRRPILAHAPVHSFQMCKQPAHNCPCDRVPFYRDLGRVLAARMAILASQLPRIPVRRQPESIPLPTIRYSH